MPSAFSTDPPQEDFAPFVAGFLKKRGIPRPSGFEASSIEPDGSERSFFRLSHRFCDQTFILVRNPPVSMFLQRENTAYLRIGNHLRFRGVPIPEIYHWDLEAGLFLVEDMGNLRLQEALYAGGHSRKLQEEVIKVLFHMQHLGASGFDTDWCCQTPRYDRQCMLQYESRYFQNEFLNGYLGLEENTAQLDSAFDHLASMASRADSGFFLHRDFQSRNILVTNEGRPVVLDWQGGRLGPLGYDLASFLVDPYMGLSGPDRKRLYGFYLQMLIDQDPSQVQSFEDTYPYLALQRNLQILGAFAFLSRIRGKAFFETFIPKAALSLLELLSSLKDPMLDSVREVMEPTHALWADA